MPVVVGSSSRTATVTLTKVQKDGKTIGFEPIKSVSGTAQKGDAFKVEGLKLVDKNGVQTDADYVIIVDDNGKIPELRIEIEDHEGNEIECSVFGVADALAKGATCIVLKHETYENVFTILSI